MSHAIQQYNAHMTYTVYDAFSPDGRRSFEIAGGENEVSFVVLPEHVKPLADLLEQLGITYKPLEI